VIGGQEDSVTEQRMQKDSVSEQRLQEDSASDQRAGGLCDLAEGAGGPSD
jgi:hypothetical protein